MRWAPRYGSGEAPTRHPPPAERKTSPVRLCFGTGRLNAAGHGSWRSAKEGSNVVRRFWRTALVLSSLLTAGAAGAFSIAAGARGAGLASRGVLANSVPRLAALARNLGTVNPAARIRIVLPLRLPHVAALNA